MSDSKETKAFFLDERLFRKRQVLITGQIDDELASAVTKQLLALAAENNDPIDVFVSSPGGHVESGDMIHDIICFIEPRVRMIGTGWVASAGALIYVAVPKEERVCLPNTRFLLHQPSGGMGGSAADMAIQAEQIIKMRERLNRIFADATGQALERIAKNTERDHWLSTNEAIDYGLVSRVIKSARELE